MRLDCDCSSSVQFSFHAWQAGGLNADSGIGECIVCLRQFKFRVGNIHASVCSAIHESAGVADLRLKLCEPVVDRLRGPARIIIRAVTFGAGGSLGQTYEVVIRMLDLV